jgi:two-component system nitrogen regulation response regulator GlnG
MMKAGAYDYLTGKGGKRKLLGVLRSAVNGGNSKNSGQLKEVSNGHLSLQEVMGSGKKIQNLAAEVERVAATGYSVLVIGETGVGKELVARALHAGSPRSSARFVPVDCGAIPETLIESELFGYEKGAFTGANRTKNGKFESASKGTLFLDEISNLPHAMQSKLLRILQERRFYRVGGNTPLRTDVRIVAATNQNLLSSTGPASFRRDLYYRLAEYVVHVPPLRERSEDIIFLSRRFIEITCAELGKNVRHISENAQEMLLSHGWPGNVRELRNVIRRAVLLAENAIVPQHLNHLKTTGIEMQCAHNEIMSQLPVQELAGVGKYSLTELVRRNRNAVERAILSRVLEQAGGNKAEVARILQVDYKTVHTKLKNYKINLCRKWKLPVSD